MDYYNILGIDLHSSTDEIKKHYYKLAKEYHPDKTKGDVVKSEKFKLLSEAYSTLSNPKERFIYDLKMKYNLQPEFVFIFTDEEYEQLHHYYNKIMNTTEIKFLKLLFKSLPKRSKENIIETLFENQFRRSSTTLICLKDIRYINISELNEDYIINLCRKFKDIYSNKLKQIIILNKEEIYYLFITSFDYKIVIKNREFLFTINIIGNLDIFKNKKYDLIYNKKINLYQYYYGDNHTLNLNNQNIIINISNKTQKIESLGLHNPHTNRRGDLIVNFIVDLDKHNLHETNTNEEIIYRIFNI